VHVLVLVQEQVRGLHVAVDDALGVRGVERSRGLLEPLECLPRRDPPRSDAILERAAAEVFHDDEGAAYRLSDVEDRDDVRATGEACRGERLPGEALPDSGILRVVLGEDLHGNRAAQQLVGRAVDLAHAAAPDLLGPSVSIGKDHERGVASRPRWKTPPGAER
jgi:hypothetical protein